MRGGVVVVVPAGSHGGVQLIWGVHLAVQLMLGEQAFADVVGGGAVAGPTKQFLSGEVANLQI